MDKALWRVYFWVQGIPIALPIRAETRFEARRLANKEIGKVTKSEAIPGGEFWVDEEDEEARQ